MCDNKFFSKMKTRASIESNGLDILHGYPDFSLIQIHEFSRIML
ncbi:hypothetical protein PPL_07984 [Heterostelium album PN500]|uniref:Uncharacterized protein n=1 Tax=Heterostelium pallidum (strain ATCC 26659 / Pp 5 / PN500) TaxID=670386 RepID=D3BHI2_HETP5|nr:hypothetical protein PPL_07984 [Heterostelium album PN500]EFA79159.1 hypothetical protein PPL_07984 [Heterostelium album PN500]|eukprot:XP_020431281.1 hypothetical protein PPL_07984 [Heterostelium album PN500]